MKRIFPLWTLAWLGLLLCPPPATAQDEEPLAPEQAFPVTLTAPDAGTLRAEWHIADGYYLYRSKIHFSSDTPGVHLGEAQLPAGEVKHDKFFGDVEIYRGDFTATVPVQRDAGTPDTISVTAQSQGCADMGLCFPPHRQSVSLQLPASTPAQSATTKGGTDTIDRQLGLYSEQEFLDPDKAFAFSAEVADGHTLIARWRIAHGYYLYRDKFAFKLSGPKGIALDAPELPPGDDKNDPTFGHIRVFHDQVEARLPLRGTGEGATQVTLEAKYQGCATAGLCYPPITKQVALQLPASGQAAAPVRTAVQKPAAPQASPGEADRFTRLLETSGIGMVMLYALGFGVLLAFTACMYPMIPIVSGIIVGQGAEITAARGLGLSAVYVFAMAFTFGVIGGVMALFGGGVGIQASFQSPWLLIPFALLFVVLALGMFGLYNIQMPSALQSRLSILSNRQRGGTLLGVAVMGSLSALIIGPCGGPVLIAALAYAAASGAVVKGFLALFMLGAGMGLPLLLVGAGGGKLLPRAGHWMNAVKAAAGVVLLAVAIAVLERMPALFPPMLTMLLWATLLIVSATYLGALSPLPEGAGGWRRLWKGVGTVLLLYGFVVMVGGITGATSVADPLHGSSLTARAGGGYAPNGAAAGAGVQAEAPVRFKRIKTVDDLKREISAANAAGKMVMLDFYADWCTYCKQFEHYVFNDPAVQHALSGTVLLQADVTATDGQDKQLMRSVDVFLPPAILFFGRDGKERRSDRVIGFMDAREFLRHLGTTLH